MLAAATLSTRVALLSLRRAHSQGRVGTTKTGKVRDVPLPPPLKAALKQHRQRLVRDQAPGLSEGLVFPSRVGTYLRNASLRKPLGRALEAAGVSERFIVHGFRQTWNNLLRQVASGANTRSMIGHETEEMFLHYCRIEREEKQTADRAAQNGTSCGSFQARGRRSKCRRFRNHL